MQTDNTILQQLSSSAVPGMDPAGKRPDNPEEAAKQFEQILVKQMVQTMTKDLFDGGITGDDAPQWLGAYSDMQGDVLATELAKQMTENGRLGIAELLMKQWARTADAGEAETPSTDLTEDPS